MIAVLAFVLAACGGGGGSSSSGPTEIAVWHGYQDTEGDVFKGLVDQYNKEHPDVEGVGAVLLQRPCAAEGSDGGARRQRTRRGLHVRVVVAEHRQDPADRRHDGRGGQTRLEVGRLLSGRARRGDRRRQGRRRACAGGQPRDRLQQEALRRCGRRAALAGLDMGRLPGGSRQADRPVEGTVRLADPRRRQRRHRVALRPDALGGGRRHPVTGQPEGGVQLGGRSQGTDRPAADGGHRQVALPRHHQRERAQADEQRQGRRCS